MASDMEILRQAYDKENDSRSRSKLWAAFNVGATQADINRLVAEELISQSHRSARIGRYDYSPALYRLTEKGRSLVFATVMEREFERVPAADILESMSLIVGFDDLKQAVAQAIESRRKINFLLEGPPASIHGNTEVWVNVGSGPEALPIASLEGKRFTALAVHPQTLKAEWYPAELSTHEYDGDWVEVAGRGVLPFTVTSTHSLVAYDPIKSCLIPKKAGDLKVGELLPIIRYWPIPSRYSPTDKVYVHGSSLFLDTDFGFLLGFWLGDGGLAQGKTKLVTFSNQKTEILEQLKGYLAQQIKRSGNYYRGGHLRKGSLLLQHKPFFDFLKREFLQGDGPVTVKGRTTRRKHLPSWVMEAPEPFVCELLKGYFYADGTVTNGVISVCTTSPKLLQDIAMLITRLGITPAIQRQGKDAQLIVIRQCDAQRFIDKVGIFREDKSVTTSVLLHDESFKAPFPFNKELAVSLMTALRKGRSSQSMTRRAATELLGTKWPEQLFKLLNSDIRWVRVQHIRRFQEMRQKVYDLSVPEAETFVLGNRVLVHNCAKSLILEGVRSAVSSAYIAFGSRTSAAGLSDALFEHQPSILLLDEIDKMHNDCYSVLLGLMESGEILETKSKKTRGVKLDTMVIGACNSTAKMPPEFLSRFALHVFFPSYSRDEFIDVCRGFLTQAENCPEDIAITIGKTVFDYALGDVRKARGVWQLMTAPTEDEVHRVARLMKKYSRDNHNHNKKQKREANRLL